MSNPAVRKYASGGRNHSEAHRGNDAALGSRGLAQHMVTSTPNRQDAGGHGPRPRDVDGRTEDAFHGLGAGAYLHHRQSNLASPRTSDRSHSSAIGSLGDSGSVHASQSHGLSYDMQYQRTYQEPSVQRYQRELHTREGARPLPREVTLDTSITSRSLATGPPSSTTPLRSHAYGGYSGSSSLRTTPRNGMPVGASHGGGGGISVAATIRELQLKAEHASRMSPMAAAPSWSDENAAQLQSELQEYKSEVSRLTTKLSERDRDIASLSIQSPGPTRSHAITPLRNHAPGALESATGPGSSEATGIREPPGSSEAAMIGDPGPKGVTAGPSHNADAVLKAKLEIAEKELSFHKTAFAALQDELALAKTSLSQRDVDLQTVSAQLRGATDNAKSRDTELLGADAELRTLQNQFVAMQETVARERQQHSRALEHAQTICKDFGADNTKLQNEVMTLRRELSRAMDTTRHTEQSNLQRLQNEMWTERDALVSAHSTEVEDLRRQLRAARSSASQQHTEQIRMLNEDVEALKQENEELVKSNREFREKLQAARVQVNESTSKMVAAQEDADVLRSELSRVIDDNRKEQNQRLKASAAQQDARAELEATVTSLERELQTTRRQLREATQRNNHESDEHTATVSALRRTAAQLEETTAALVQAQKNADNSQKNADNNHHHSPNNSVLSPHGGTHNSTHNTSTPNGSRNPSHSIVGSSEREDMLRELEERRKTTDELQAVVKELEASLGAAHADKQDSEARYETSLKDMAEHQERLKQRLAESTRELMESHDCISVILSSADNSGNTSGALGVGGALLSPAQASVFRPGVHVFDNDDGVAAEQDSLLGGLASQTAGTPPEQRPGAHSSHSGVPTAEETSPPRVLAMEGAVVHVGTDDETVLERQQTSSHAPASSHASTRDHAHTLVARQADATDGTPRVQTDAGMQTRDTVTRESSGMSRRGMMSVSESDDSVWSLLPTPESVVAEGLTGLHRLLFERWEVAGVNPSVVKEIDDVIATDLEYTATVYNSDMSGFTRLTKSHGILHFLSMIAKMRSIVKPIIERNDGTIVHFDGDNVIATFPSPVKAAESAFMVQNVLRSYNASRDDDTKILLTIGLAHGPVLNTGTQLFGNTWELAAALGEDIGSKRHVLLDRSVAQHVDLSAMDVVDDAAPYPEDCADFGSDAYTVVRIPDESDGPTPPPREPTAMPDDDLGDADADFEASVMQALGGDGESQNTRKRKAHDDMDVVQDLLVSAINNKDRAPEIHRHIMDEYSLEGFVLIVKLDTDGAPMDRLCALGCAALLIDRVRTASCRLVKRDEQRLFLFAQDLSDAMTVAFAALDICRTLTERNPTLPVTASAGIAKGSTLVFSHDYYGNSVNIASKLGEDHAEPGEFYIDADTYRTLSARAVESYGNKEITFTSVTIDISKVTIDAYAVTWQGSINKSVIGLGLARSKDAMLQNLAAVRAEVASAKHELAQLQGVNATHVETIARLQRELDDAAEAVEFHQAETAEHAQLLAIEQATASKLAHELQAAVDARQAAEILTLRHAEQLDHFRATLSDARADNARAEQVWMHGTDKLVDLATVMATQAHEHAACTHKDADERVASTAVADAQQVAEHTQLQQALHEARGQLEEINTQLTSARAEHESAQTALNDATALAALREEQLQSKVRGLTDAHAALSATVTTHIHHLDAIFSEDDVQRDVDGDDVLAPRIAERLSDLLAQVQSQRGLVDDLERQLVAATDRIQSLQQALDVQHVGFQQDQATHDKIRSSLQQRVRELEQRLALQEESTRTFSAKYADAKEALDKKVEEYETLLATHNSLQQTLTEIEAERATIAEQAADGIAAATWLEKTTQELVDTRDRLTAAEVQLREDHDTAAAKVARLEAAVQATRIERDEQRVTIRSLEATVEQQEQQLRSLHVAGASSTTPRALEQMNSKYAELKADYDAALEESRQAREETRITIARYSKMRSAVQAASENIARELGDRLETVVADTSAVVELCRQLQTRSRTITARVAGLERTVKSGSHSMTTSGSSHDGSNADFIDNSKVMDRVIQGQLDRAHRSIDAHKRDLLTIRQRLYRDVQVARQEEDSLALDVTMSLATSSPFSSPKTARRAPPSSHATATATSASLERSLRHRQFLKKLAEKDERTHGILRSLQNSIAFRAHSAPNTPLRGGQAPDTVGGAVSDDGATASALASSAC